MGKKDAAAKDTRSALERFYDNQVRELVSRHADEEVRDQVENAFKEPPANPDDVDLWFEKHFHAAPVSHDTQLYSQLYAMKAQLRLIVGEQG